MENNRYILAMYDIRGKQEFIYRTGKIKAIMGASYMIRDCFEDYLYPAAKACSSKGIFSYKKKENEDAEFTPGSFERHLEEGYIGEVVYDGGGNFFVLYRDADAYRTVNRKFYRSLLEGTYSLRVLTTYIEGVDFDDFTGDRNRLYEKHHRRERQETMLPPVNTLPIVQTDYQTSLPLTEICQGSEGKEKVSRELAKKYKKYDDVDGNGTGDREIQGKRKLDDLITKKGEESLLAVVYIDGNNMGAQVQKCIGSQTSYETCVKALREFSDDIQKNYIDDRIEDVNRLLLEKGAQGRRFIVYAGDEVTFICNARQAYDVAKEYLTELYKSSPEGAPRTSCAGIAVFHSHAPFADAYRIAEECCESGKKLMKELKMTDASLIDFHYCQGAFGTSLGAIRRDEGTETLSRPWFVVCEEKDRGKGETLVAHTYFSDDTVQKMRRVLNDAGRGNIKDLAMSAKRSAVDFLAEKERITAHNAEKEIDFSLGGELDDDQQLRLISDMVLVYDIWFDDTKEGREG